MKDDLQKIGVLALVIYATHQLTVYLERQRLREKSRRLREEDEQKRLVERLKRENEVILRKSAGRGDDAVQ